MIVLRLVAKFVDELWILNQRVANFFQIKFTIVGFISLVFFVSFFGHKFINGFNDNKDHEGNDQKVDDGVDETPEFKRGAGNFKGPVWKINSPDEEPNQRVN